MQNVFRALLVNCVPQDTEILSAFFLIPMCLIWRVNNRTAQTREVISTTTKVLEENFRSKSKKLT